MHEVSGYNAAIAVDQVLPLADMEYMNYITYRGYYQVNQNYGALQSSYDYTINYGPTTIHYVIEDPVAYYYSDKTQTWEVADYTLGFYKPFSDYSQEGNDDLRTANIAIVSESYSSPTLPTNGLMPITPIYMNPDYAVTFYLTADASMIYENYPGKSETNDMIIEYLSQNPITIAGYGSDAYLALKDISNKLGFPDMNTGGNVTMYGNTIFTYYGIIWDMLGLEFGYLDWHYEQYGWGLYYGDGTYDYSYCMLGWMSPLNEASTLNDHGRDFVQNEFTLQYGHLYLPMA